MNIDKSEVLRYLGYKKGKLSLEITSIIDECIEEIKEEAKPKYVYSQFQIKLETDEVSILNTTLLLKGKHIFELLKHSTECVLMAATLGVSIDNKIRYNEKFDMTRAVILDACATTAIESLCDEAENIIRNEANANKKSITYRYSPGYGDLPIDMQGELLKVLNAERRIGLTATENSILLPRKSVTAVIGIIDPNNPHLENKRGCIKCSKYENCDYRKDGNCCGN